MYAARKVPQIGALFWVVKVLTTAFGESASDFLVVTVNPAIAVIIGFVLFMGAITLQFRARKYIPRIYWFAVAMVALFGTMAADVLHIGLGVPYLYSTIFLAAVLAVIFALWYRIEQTLSIHAIDSVRRESFYWLTVVTTFALGTAAGDMTASTLGLGYFASGVLFAAFIALVAFVHYAAEGMRASEHRHRSRNAVIAFWLAYIVTRPLGASFADWAGKVPSVGGLGWGDGTVSLILGIMIVALVAYLAYTHADVDHGRP